MYKYKYIEIVNYVLHLHNFKALSHTHTCYPYR